MSVNVANIACRELMPKHWPSDYQVLDHLEFRQPEFAETGPVTLLNGRVDIWKIDPASACISAGTLSREECMRAADFRLEADRRSFISSRAALRQILARYTGTPAAEITFGQGEHGKPWLKVPQAKIHFNLSHARTLSLIAISTSGEIGIDIEGNRKISRMHALAKRYFPRPQMLAWQSLPMKDQQRGFLTYWTQTEAILKAHGIGIANRHHATEYPKSLYSFLLENGHVGSLACRFQLKSIRAIDGLRLIAGTGPLP